MSSLDGENGQVFNSIEDKAIYWENRSKALEAQVIQLQARVRQLESKRQREDSSTDDDDEEDPAKKMCMEEINKDYFKILPDHCAEMIMSHLDGIELYRMTKVSSDWKMIVESDKTTAEKIESALTLDAWNDMEEVVKFNDIEYKHLMVNTNIFGRACINRFTSTIESLEINLAVTNDISHSHKSLNLTFPQLKKLTIVHDSRVMEWFSNCKFPLLSVLKLHNVTIYDYANVGLNDYDAVRRTLASMPNLKHLNLTNSGFDLEPLIEQLINKLESLHLLSVSEEIINGFSLTLPTLEIDYSIDQEIVELILSQMKNLKNLTINVVNHEELPLTEMTTNTSITSLRVNPNYCYDDDDPMILVILKALPSLEIFYYHEHLDYSFLDVIVRNNLKMKKLICGNIGDDVLSKYEELKLKESDNDQINTSIEIVIEDLWKKSWWFLPF